MDKVADDVVNRICRDNNKPLGSNDPGVKCNQSYLILSPAMTPASSQAILDPDNDEPDIHRDDYHYRSIRDFQVKFDKNSILMWTLRLYSLLRKSELEIAETVAIVLKNCQIQISIFWWKKLARILLTFPPLGAF